MKPLVKPSPNLNGTPDCDLVNQYMSVANTARELLDNLAKASPHGRDYPPDYIYKHGDLSEAREAFGERYRTILALEEEFVRMAVSLHRGEDK